MGIFDNLKDSYRKALARRRAQHATPQPPQEPEADLFSQTPTFRPGETARAKTAQEMDEANRAAMPLFNGIHDIIPDLTTPSPMIPPLQQQQAHDDGMARTIAAGRAEDAAFEAKVATGMLRVAGLDGEATTREQASKIIHKALSAMAAGRERAFAEAMARAAAKASWKALCAAAEKAGVDRGKAAESIAASARQNADKLAHERTAHADKLAHERAAHADKMAARSHASQHVEAPAKPHHTEAPHHVQAAHKSTPAQPVEAPAKPYIEAGQRGDPPQKDAPSPHVEASAKDAPAAQRDSLGGFLQAVRSEPKHEHEAEHGAPSDNTGGEEDGGAQQDKRREEQTRPEMQADAPQPAPDLFPAQIQDKEAPERAEQKDGPKTERAKEDPARREPGAAPAGASDGPRSGREQQADERQPQATQQARTMDQQRQAADALLMQKAAQRPQADPYIETMKALQAGPQSGPPTQAHAMAGGVAFTQARTAHSSPVTPVTPMHKAPEAAQGHMEMQHPGAPGASSPIAAAERAGAAAGEAAAAGVVATQITSAERTAPEPAAPEHKQPEAAQGFLEMPAPDTPAQPDTPEHKEPEAPEAAPQAEQAQEHTETHAPEAPQAEQTTEPQPAGPDKPDAQAGQQPEITESREAAGDLEAARTAMQAEQQPVPEPEPTEPQADAERERSDVEAEPEHEAEPEPEEPEYGDDYDDYGR